MVNFISPSRRVFLIFNYLFLSFLTVICMFPVIHVLAISLSSSTAAMSGEVVLLPKDFTLKSYRFVLEKPEFMQAFFVSVKRVAIGVPLNMLLTVMVAYPLSKEKREFKARDFFVWYFLITVLFGGGLIPLYVTVNLTGLINSIWALVIPTAVPVLNVILLLNFFRNIPKELEESAFLDGASHWTTLFKIMIPLSKPALATLTLFVMVGHWNQWFDGLIYMNSVEKYPLQSYLQTTVINRDIKLMTEQDLELMKYISERTSKAAEIFVAMLPILVVYPFLQRYFITGITLGSVKG